MNFAILIDSASPRLFKLQKIDPFSKEKICFNGFNLLEASSRDCYDEKSNSLIAQNISMGRGQDENVEKLRALAAKR